MVSKGWMFLAIAGLVVSLAPGAFAGDAGFRDGHWRTEIAVGTGVDSGSTDRAGDILVVGSVEWEFPVTDHIALGLRLLPLVTYAQDNEHNDDWFEDVFHGNDDYDGDTVWGAGFGFATRFYQIAKEQRGVFFEIEANALFHGNEFNGNGSNVNFLTGAGLGYKFKKPFHVTARFEHISNAGLDDDNSGVNAATLAFGYSF